MFFNGELTAGAIGIMLTIVSTGVSGIIALVTIYFRTRTDITKLQLNYVELKTDIASMAGKADVMTERMNKQDLMLERISTRIELMGAITGLPDQLAIAMGRLVSTQRGNAGRVQDYQE